MLTQDNLLVLLKYIFVTGQVGDVEMFVSILCR